MRLARTPALAGVRGARSYSLCIVHCVRAAAPRGAVLAVRGCMQNEALRITDDEDLDILRLATVSGGTSRSSQFTGTKALMLAVLEDGIRSYLGGSRLLSQEGDWWIRSPRRGSPFSFVVICETLGLDPTAVRTTLEHMKTQKLPRRALPRSRHNVRVPGRVYARRTKSPRER
jgi:hypothetical protein